MPEQLLKLSPNRGVYLRGTDSYGAFASITGASSTGFTLNTKFSDSGDFTVVVLADSENGGFEHQLMRPLPDFDYTGLILSFNWSSSGVFPIDSRYFPTVNQNRLGVITHDPTTGAEQNIVCSLWENATLASGSFTAATASFTVTHDPNINDVITLFIGNTAFGYTGTGFDTAATVASSLAVAINTYDWSSFAEASIAVFATWNGSSGVTLTFARTGKVTVSGSTVTWADNGSLPSELFVGLTAGLPFVVNGNTYTISSVTNAKTLVLTSAPSGLTGGTKYTYMAPMGGEDGNGLTCYIVPSPSNSGITLSATTLNFTGGVSDGLVWTINLNFASLTGVLPANVANPLNPSVTQYAAGHLRQIFLTVGPKINASAPYAATQGVVTVSNWSVTGTNRNLYVAGPGSVRIGSRDSWATYTGSWSEDAANVHYQGFARVSSTSGNSISVKYACGSTHDLYIGTEFYTDRQIVNVSLDGDTATAFDTYQATQSWGRRRVRSSVASGQHVLTITLTGTHNSAAVADGSGHYSFLFDFLEAAVSGQVQAPSVTYSNVTAALDLDTYPSQMTPERLVWQLATLGLLGKVNLDLGVFWLYNRVRVGGTFDAATITFSGSWSYGDSATVNISGFVIGKSIVSGDTPTTIALHFAYYINGASVGFWASASAGVLTITQRSTGSEFAATVTASKSSSGGSVSPSSQSIGVGTEGTWTINDTTYPLLNCPVRAWLLDFYQTLYGASLQCVSAVTMEVVNPPLSALSFPAPYSSGSAAIAPPTPSFTLTTDSLGNLILQGIGFASGAPNQDSVSSATLAIFSRSTGGSSPTLASGISSSAGSITLSASASYSFGQAILIDSEIVVALSGSGTSWSIARAALGSTAASHSSGATVYALTQSTYNVPIAEGFFTRDPLASDFEFIVPLASSVVSAAELVVTNSYGASSSATLQCYSSVSGGGIATGSGPSGTNYTARFADGTAVTTATGLGSLNSNQCAVGAFKVIALQKETFAEVANLQNAAGLPVNLQCGEWGYWYYSEKQSVPIGNVANTYPAVIGLAVAHGMSSGQNCVIAGVVDGSGNVPAVNGTWSVTVVDTTHFSIAVAGGTWTSGTGVVSYGGMAVYDAETASAAATALGRPLASFYTQDDNPSANAADIAFLQARLMSHFSAVQSYIAGLYSGALLELLLPLDVNNPTVYWNVSWPYAQGGRWNKAVNLPSALWTKSGSGFNKLLIECLSWSASYHNLNLAKAAMAWPVSGGRSWTFADITYLVANFSGSCCFAAEYLAAANYGYLQLRIWAADQTLTMGTPLPLPVNQSTASSS